MSINEIIELISQNCYSLYKDSTEIVQNKDYLGALNCVKLLKIYSYDSILDPFEREELKLEIKNCAKGNSLIPEFDINEL